MDAARPPVEGMIENKTGTVLIAGLKRSGTTILWETFRQDRALHCFDEPFHPGLWSGKRENAKNTLAELASAWEARDFSQRPDLKPIQPFEELESGNTDAQRRYLAELCRYADRTVIDEVRIWNRLPDLVPADRPTVVVHLLRHPDNWVTGHMNPVLRRQKRTTRLVRSATFFRRRTGFNTWRYEDIFNAAISMEHPMWSVLPLPPRRLAGQPAYVKLLAFWWASNLLLHRRLAAWHGGPVLTVTLAEFARDPAAVMSRIYGAAGWTLPADGLCFKRVSAVRSSWEPQSRHWISGFSKLGIPHEFMNATAISGDRAAALFDGHT